VPPDILYKYLFALGLSLAIETPVAAAVLRKHGRLGTIIAAALCGTVLTHVAIHFVLIKRFHVHGLWLHVGGESFAVAAEALIYWLFVRPARAAPAVYASLAANAASYLAGLLVF
jgi:hypothetical protein